MAAVDPRRVWSKSPALVKRQVPSPLIPAIVPLPTIFYGVMCVIECFDKTLYSLQCEDEKGEVVSYSLDEDELRGVLAKFSFPAIPRIISTAKFSEKIQVVPHLHDGGEEQIIPIYPKNPPCLLDFRDEEDWAPDHVSPLK